MGSTPKYLAHILPLSQFTKCLRVPANSPEMSVAIMSSLRSTAARALSMLRRIVATFNNYQMR